MDLIKQYWYIGNAVQTMNLLKYLLIILFIYKCYAVMNALFEYKYSLVSRRPDAVWS